MCRSEKSKAIIKRVVLFAAIALLLTGYAVYAYNTVYDTRNPPELEMDHKDSVYTNKYGEKYILQKSWFKNMTDDKKQDYNRYSVYTQNDGKLLFYQQGGDPCVKDIFLIGETDDLRQICYLIILSGGEDMEYIIWREENSDTDIPFFLPVYLYEDKQNISDFFENGVQCGNYKEMFKYLSENYSAVKEKICDMGYSDLTFDLFYNYYISSGLLQ